MGGRSPRWFTPTGKPKAIAGSVRPYAKMQASGMSAEQQNEAIGSDLRGRYEKFGVQAIQPTRALDVRHDQLIPGRHRMLAHFGALDRHAGTVDAIEGGEIVLSDGARVAVDLVLWGTGYATDLSYFEDERLASIHGIDELSSRCGCIFRSLDAPDLYFPGVGLDGIGAAPWACALMARSIMSHIRGTARLDMEPLGYKINHFDIAKYLSERDPGTYGEAQGWDFYRRLALETPDDQPYPLPEPTRRSRTLRGAIAGPRRDQASRRTARLCVARPISPTSSYSADSARPLPWPPSSVRESRQIHSPTGRRSRLIVRSQLTKL